MQKTASRSSSPKSRAAAKRTLESGDRSVPAAIAPPFSLDTHWYAHIRARWGRLSPPGHRGHILFQIWVLLTPIRP